MANPFRIIANVEMSTKVLTNKVILPIINKFVYLLLPIGIIIPNVTFVQNSSVGINCGLTLAFKQSLAKNRLNPTGCKFIIKPYAVPYEEKATFPVISNHFEGAR